MVSDVLYSRCGNRCDLCLIYRPNVEKEDRRAAVCDAWRKMWSGFDPDPATVICDGCRDDSEGAVLFSPTCETRKCVINVCIEHCGFCGSYPCAIFPAEPSPEEVVQKVEVEGQWTWEDERLMAAYTCKRNMDAFRKDR